MEEAWAEPQCGDNDDNDDNDVFSHTQVTPGQGLHICQNNTVLLTKYVNSLLYDPLLQVAIRLESNRKT